MNINENSKPRLPKIVEENDLDDEYDNPYEYEDLPPYTPGEAYDAYCQDPTYDNAIEAAEEIWGIPDPRLIGLD
jgi:hypothetical protein